MSWSREEVTVLIDKYKKQPCLYTVQSPQYKNKHARNAALTEICRSLKPIKTGVTIGEVKSKFAALRQNFIVEYRKHVNPLKSGAGTEQVYIPSIWYYDLMLFIVQHTTPKPAVFDSVPDSGNSQISSIEDTQIEFVFEDDTHGDTPCYEETSIEVTPSTSKAMSEPKSKRKKPNKYDYLVDASTAINQIAAVIADKKSAPPAKEDRIDIFLKYMATKLRRIKDEDILDDTESEIIDVIQKNINKCRDAI